MNAGVRWQRIALLAAPVSAACLKSPGDITTGGIDLCWGWGRCRFGEYQGDLAVTDRRLPYLADFYSLLDRMPIADLRRATMIAATGCCPRFGSHDAVGRLDDVDAYRIYRKAPCNV